jgi:hypothetical protein
LKILQFLPRMPCYARVDGIARGDEFLLMELELLEPELFLEIEAQAAPRFAAAIVGAIARHGLSGDAASGNNSSDYVN